MPIVLLAAVLFIAALLVYAFYLDGEDVTAKYTLSVLILLCIWTTLASIQENRYLGESLQKIHESPDGYQYTTLPNGTIYNVTKSFGRTFPEGSELRVETPEKYYLGIRFDLSPRYTIKEPTEEK